MEDDDDLFGSSDDDDKEQQDDQKEDNQETEDKNEEDEENKEQQTREEPGEDDEEQQEINYGPPEQLEYTPLPKPTTQTYYVRLPNVLQLDSRPFDPETFQHNPDAEESRLVIPEAIRWRYTTRPDGKVERESNTRMVKWEDGTVQLFVGNEIYDMGTQKTAVDSNYLFVRQRGFIKCHGHFDTRMNFTPFTAQSKSHQKLREEIEKRHKQKERRIRLHNPSIDPELEKSTLEKAEQQRLKAKKQLDSKRKKKGYSRDDDDQLNVDMLEETENGDDYRDDLSDEEGNIAAIKSKYKKNKEKKKSRRDRDDEESLKRKRR